MPLHCIAESKTAQEGSYKLTVEHKRAFTKQSQLIENEIFEKAILASMTKKPLLSLLKRKTAQEGSSKLTMRHKLAPKTTAQQIKNKISVQR